MRFPLFLIPLLERLSERRPPRVKPGEVEHFESDGESADPPSALDDEFWAAMLDNRGRSRKSQRKRDRPREDVTAAVIHQAGFQWAPEVARRNMWKINGHIAISSDGTWSWNHPFESYLFAADLANRFSVSIELIGNFEGHPGKGDFWKPEKFGKGAPTSIQIRRCRQVLRWLVSHAALRHEEPRPLPLTGCFAHRQFRTGQKAPKVLDPGWQAYRGVNLWARRELGLANRERWTLGNGARIPPSWPTPGPDQGEA